MSIKFFEQIKFDDISGGKGSSLAKMYQNNINVPNGYVVMADVFDNFIKENDVENDIHKIIKECDIEDEISLSESSKKIIQIIYDCEIPKRVEARIIENFEILDCKYVAVRSSATSEDGKEHAWAGQLETFLNIDKENLIDSIKKCWCSLFSPRAIFYRIKNNDISNISVAVVVQKMIQSEVSGVAFSVNPTNNKNEVIVEAVLGLGEAIVSGKVTPDTYTIDKENRNIVHKEIRSQKAKLVKINEKNEWVKIEGKDIQKLDDDTVLKLFDLIKKIEEFYGFQVDIEWGIENNKIYILQCRPITTVKKNELLEKIKNAGEWNFYVSRKFNWFVENTEIYSTMEKFQNELFGFYIPTQNYLCLNGDEYALESDFELLCNRLNSYLENDSDFFEKFAKLEFDLVENIKECLEYLKNKKFEKLEYKELIEEFKKFNDMYIKSFIPGMTRPEEFLTYTLEKRLISEKYSKEEVEEIFSKISTCPNYFPLSYSEEPLDLLKLALKRRNGDNIANLLEEHIEKYAWIKGPVEFEDTCFKREEYLLRIENLMDTNIEEKIYNIEKVRKDNDIEYEKVLEEYQFSLENKKLIKAIRDFIFLRTYTTEYSDHLFYLARHTILKEISNRTGIEDIDLIMLDNLEIIDILKNQGKMTKIIKKTLDERKKGFAMIWLNGHTTTIFGDKSIELQNEIASIYKIANEDDNLMDKTVISGSVANKGKVRGIARVLKRYEDIYNVQKDDIIVATMTTPDYVSAMEKASGFITDEGGITCHAAILSREFNVPCIVGTINATKEIKDGELIELDAYAGKVYILDR